MLLKRWVILAALLLASVFGARCFASTITFTAMMMGTSETPPNASTGTGFATVTLNGDILTVHETWSGLSTNPSAAHIHCCAVPGVAASVVIPFSAFPSTTSGTFDRTFDLSTFAFGGGLNEATFIAGLDSGLAYVNIHNTNFPGGEIRGQLLVATPEPASLLLLGTGVIGLAGAARRRLRA